MRLCVCLIFVALCAAFRWPPVAAPLGRQHWARQARSGLPTLALARRARSGLPTLALATKPPTEPLTEPLPPRSAATPREQPYEVLRGEYDREKLVQFFLQRPGALLGRLLAFAKSLYKVRSDWVAEDALPAENRTRGARLRKELAMLGPVAVKLGQTLSQRPDIVPEDACEALKSLQTANEPFDSAEAWRVIAQETGHPGPIAPGIVAEGCAEPDGEPLFRKLGAAPIASASLGQVYRGTTTDGVEVAVKVQRPGAMRQVALDFAVLVLVLKLATRAGWGNGDLDEILDTVAAGIFEELDYRNEARNAAAFKRSMDFLGYVDVPRVLPELSTGATLLVSEWVYGRHLEGLDRREGLRMTYMAVEAVTASLVVTGLVHADPHEGNVMLADDGRLVFLDFGLMSRVEEEIMEAFASGIQALLNRDYEALVQVVIMPLPVSPLPSPPTSSLLPHLLPSPAIFCAGDDTPCPLGDVTPHPSSPLLTVVCPLPCSCRPSSTRASSARRSSGAPRRARRFRRSTAWRRRWRPSCAIGWSRCRAARRASARSRRCSSRWERRGGSTRRRTSSCSSAPS